MARKESPEDIPGFFKVMVGDFSKRMQIPPAFTKFFYQTPLPHKIKLQSSETSCSEWKVKVVEIDNKLFFKKGWKAFVNDNLLEIGDFIVFSYVETSLFQFTIFASNNCVKDVIGKGKTKQSVTMEKNIHTNEDRRHGNVSDKNPGLKINEKPVVIKIEDTDDHDDDYEDAISVEFLRKKRQRTDAPKSKEGNQDESVDRKCKQRKVHHKKIKKLGSKERSLVIERAKRTFKSNNPFFMVAIQPSYIGIGKNNNMNVPLGFVERYFNKNNRNVILEVEDGKTWIVKYYASTQKNQQAKLNNGWLEFANENHLGVGDICAFELINTTDNIMRVYIFKHR